MWRLVLHDALLDNVSWQRSDPSEEDKFLKAPRNGVAAWLPAPPVKPSAGSILPMGLC